MALPTRGLTCSFHPACLPRGNDWVWVYESTLGSSRPTGNARIAKRQFGAEPTVYEGASGLCYAIPCSATNGPIEMETVARSIRTFLDYAASRPSTPFFVTRVGTEHARLPESFLAIQFSAATSNVSLPEEWKNAVMQARQLPLFKEPSN